MNLLRLLPRPLLGFLLLLTALALLPWEPQGPFDARDWSRLEGVRLSYPWSGVLLEPLLAPAHVIMGAPDFRIALLSVMVWLIGGALLAGALTARGARARAARGLAWAVLALGGATLYVLFMALLHLPGWRLQADEPHLLIADLQTHTLGSHDGLVTPEQNLAWHAAHGYNLIGITEHNDPAGSFRMQALASRESGAPLVVAGVEVSDERDKFLLGIAVDPREGVLPWKGNQQDYARKFMAHVHAQGGAVIALAWRLEPEDVARLTAAGIDGVELVNTGHPDVPDAVREEMLRAAREQGVVLVASTDWHGWGGFTRTWTVIDLPGAAQWTPAQRAREVVERLRARDGSGFTPVAAGYMGPPPPWRAVLAPWVESARYAAELSPLRVLAWWGWAALLGAAAFALRRSGWRAWRVIAAGAVAGIAAVLGARALELRSYVTEGAPHDYALQMGTPALGVSLAALAFAGLLLWLEFRRFRAARGGRPG